MFRELVVRNRYYLIGAALLGMAAACFEKQGAIDYAADRVWEHADEMTRRAAEPAENTKE